MWQLALDSTTLRFVQLWFSAMVSVCVKEKSPLWVVTFSAFIKDKYIELCWFRKVTFVCSPPRSVCSLILGSWLDFQYQTWSPYCWVQLESCWLLPWYYFTLWLADQLKILSCEPTPYNFLLLFPSFLSTTIYWILIHIHIICMHIL